MKVKKENVEDILGLSSVQSGILYEYLIANDVELYVAQISLHIGNDINVELLKSACCSVCQANEMLRCVYRWEGLKEPVQIVLKNYQIPFQYFGNIKDEEMIRLKKEQAIKEIDIQTSPVIIQLFKCLNWGYDFVITWHHIVYDGWSNMVFLKEVFMVYEALMEGKSLVKTKKAKYKEFISWSRKRENSQELFWQEYFSGFRGKSRQMMDLSVSSTKKKKIGRYFIQLTEELGDRMNVFLKQNHATVADFMYAVWSIIIYRYTEDRDFNIGITMSGRTAEIADLNQSIGLFIQTLPLRIRLDENEDFGTLLKNITDTKRKLLNCELGNLIIIKNVVGMQSKENLFASLVVMENYPVSLEHWMKKENKPSIFIESYQWLEKNNYNLLLGILPPDYHTLVLQYSKMFYSEVYIGRLAECLQRIMDQVLDNPSLRIKEVGAYSNNEKVMMLQEANNIEKSLDFDIDYFL